MESEVDSQMVWVVGLGAGYSLKLKTRRPYPYVGEWDWGVEYCLVSKKTARTGQFPCWNQRLDTVQYEGITETETCVGPAEWIVE